MTVPIRLISSMFSSCASRYLGGGRHVSGWRMGGGGVRHRCCCSCCRCCRCCRCCCSRCFVYCGGTAALEHEPVLRLELLLCHASSTAARGSVGGRAAPVFVRSSASAAASTAAAGSGLRFSVEKFILGVRSTIARPALPSSPWRLRLRAHHVCDPTTPGHASQGASRLGKHILVRLGDELGPVEGLLLVRQRTHRGIARRERLVGLLKRLVALALPLLHLGAGDSPLRRRRLFGGGAERLGTLLEPRHVLSCHWSEHSARAGFRGPLRGVPAQLFAPLVLSNRVLSVRMPKRGVLASAGTP
mmetsp:Transcript_102532/g.293549  ORF Transcript_102532/g.293549 Transcript_102532/m.293549 type:complete len:302 (-) Transcript_102532:74-979(-)